MTKTEALIAVVDDDASVRRSIGRLLRSAGFMVVTFASAEEFLQSVDTCAPNCLVLDVHMPNMDGLALESLLAMRDDKVPIVFITAHDDQSTRERALEVQYNTLNWRGRSRFYLRTSAPVSVPDYGSYRSPPGLSYTLL